MFLAIGIFCSSIELEQCQAASIPYVFYDVETCSMMKEIWEYEVKKAGYQVYTIRCIDMKEERA